MTPTSSNQARDVILGRIRAALTDVPGDEPEILDHNAMGYRACDPTATAAKVEDLVDRLLEYKALVRRVKASELPAAIASACKDRNVKRLVIPADVPAEWVAGVAELIRDSGLSHEELDATDGVLTGCALAIAQTGTIVLDAGAMQGRRAISLVPDYHLCVVLVDQIVGLVPEAVARLRPSATRPLTWISGPSATSDIELERVEGVHGPRTLEVVIVEA